MAGIINKTDHNHPEHTVYKAREKSRVGELKVLEKSAELRKDGPTVAQFVEAGYDPKNYPPADYASRSTAEEIAEAIKNYKPKK